MIRYFILVSFLVQLCSSINNNSILILSNKDDNDNDDAESCDD